MTPEANIHHGIIRVAAVTPQLHLGDADANTREIAAAMHQADRAGCQVAVFPELSLTGYSCADLFMNTGFLHNARSALSQLCRETASLDVLAIIGMPLSVDDRLYNVAVLILRGHVIGIVPKTHLPNAWEFYERRWFSPASTLSRTSLALCGDEAIPIGTDLLFVAEHLEQCRLAVEICEDLWTIIPPSSHAAQQGATLLANLSASNELLGKADYRRQLISQQSGRCLAAYIYAAAGPGESSTDIVYGGHSIIAENGSLLAEAERFRFETTMIIADIDVQHLAHERLHSTSLRDSQAPPPPWRRIPIRLASPELGKTASDHHRPLSRHPFVPATAEARGQVCREIFAIQATGLARRLRHTQSQTLVLGLSGGLDSTLALLVALDAIQRAATRCAIITVTMPGLGTTSRTRDNATLLAQALGLDLRTVSISDAVTRHLSDIQHPIGQHDITFENAQARERTQVLMDIANQTNGIVLGTGDLSESALGWCTFNGDHMSMYHINAGVPKTLVRYLIAWCAEQPHFTAAASVLRDILDTPISPELLPADPSGNIAQKTEDSIGPYELNDFFLYHHIRRGCSREKIAWLAGLAYQGSYTTEQIDTALTRYLTRFRTQQFKRSSMPDGPKVGTVALSPRGDWRMPSDAAGM